MSQKHKIDKQFDGLRFYLISSSMKWIRSIGSKRKQQNVVRKVILWNVIWEDKYQLKKKKKTKKKKNVSNNITTATWWTRIRWSKNSRWRFEFPFCYNIKRNTISVLNSLLWSKISVVFKSITKSSFLSYNNINIE